jgi:hypothetical protein
MKGIVYRISLYLRGNIPCCRALSKLILMNRKRGAFIQLYFFIKAEASIILFRLLQRKDRQHVVDLECIDYVDA